MMPLSAVVKRKGITIDQIYKRYDTDRSMLLSADEIEKLVKNFLKTNLFKFEVQEIETYIRKTFLRKEVKKLEF